MVPSSMALFIISIPLMVLAVALAVLPLVIMSLAAERHRTGEATPRPIDMRVNVADPQDQDLPQAA
jgi:uncharacterized Tic20 family protein